MAWKRVLTGTSSFAEEEMLKPLGAAAADDDKEKEEEEEEEEKESEERCEVDLGLCMAPLTRGQLELVVVKMISAHPSMRVLEEVGECVLCMRLTWLKTSALAGVTTTPRWRTDTRRSHPHV